MNQEQLDLVRKEIPLHGRHVKGYLLDTTADVCLAWQPGTLEKFFLFRTAQGIYYAMMHYPGLSDEIELLSWNQARELWRRLPEKLVSEEAAFPRAV